MTRPDLHLRRGGAGLAALVLLAGLAVPAAAEVITLEDAVRAPVVLNEGNPFAPRLFVNELVITEYDLQQRALFYKALGAPGDPLVEAMKALIDDRLRQFEAKRLKITLTPEELTAGVTEFAGRANLTPEEFAKALEQEGIDMAAFEDFVRSGLLWRNVIRARYAGQVPVTGSEVDEALNTFARQGTARVQIEYAELLIPDNQAEIARIKASVDRCLDLYGVAGPLPEQQLNIYTRTSGEIPGDVAAELARLDPGEVSTSLTRGGARLFLMLCNRSPLTDPPADRAQISEQIIGLKAEGLAQGYLEELRSAAIIRTP